MSGYLSVLLFGCLVLHSKQSSETYRAGVVEFGVQMRADVYEYFESNLQRYLQIIKEAGEKEVDILVFPESTLNYAFTSERILILQYAFYIPDPEDKVAPCDSAELHPTLKHLSCAARDSHAYLVVNLSEKLNCDDETQADMFDTRDCGPDSHYLFNTNVVFNRYGVIVSRYRKTHLFGEFAFNTTYRPEIETFETDFGVTFGHLICFDLQYRSPALVLLDRQVDNFVLSLMWYSELPFLTAVQFEDSWAYSHSANLLAAGASSPLSGSGGSGIFAGQQGIREAIISGEVATKLMVADVYKKPKIGHFTEPGVVTALNPRRMNLLRDHLHVYNIKFIDPQLYLEGRSERLCYLEFCCDFYIRTGFEGNLSSPPDVYYEYALIVFRGVRSYSGVAQGGVENCGLTACLSRDEATCGFRFTQSIEYSPYIVFEELSLQGNFTAAESSHYPTTINGLMVPLNARDFNYKTFVNGDKKCINYSLETRQTDLLAFGIFGRVYSMDCEPVVTEREFLHHKVLPWSRGSTCEASNAAISIEYAIFIPLAIIIIYVLEMM